MQDKFQLVSGSLSFLTAPDFESPTDSDTNNTYQVEITASDGFNTTSQPLTITLTDVQLNTLCRQKRPSARKMTRTQPTTTLADCHLVGLFLFVF